MLTKPPRRILVVRLSALGDVVNCLPALEALHELWPHAVIDWVTETLGYLPLEGHRLLERVLRVPRREWSQSARKVRRWPRILAEFGVFVRKLRLERYDLIVDLQGNQRSLMICLLARGRCRVTHHPTEVKEFAALFATTPPSPSGRVLRARKHLHLVRFLGWSGAEPAPSLPGDWVLKTNGPILLHPFASQAGRFKAWPPNSFAKLARELAGCGHEIWVSWGPGERAAAEAIVRASDGAAALAPSSEGPGELLALLRSARLLVAADTGVLHLAAAGGVPTLGLYGPKDVAIYAPFGPRTRVARSSIPCSPCTLRACDHAVCMQLLEPSQVAVAVRELLKSSENLRAMAGVG